jgi:hypothetical protein
MPRSTLLRSVSARLRAVLSAFSRFNLESEGVYAVDDEPRSPALSGPLAMPRSEPPARDVEDHETDVGGDNHDHYDRE